MLNEWAKRFVETGNLMRRLDVGEGSYSREIEEDYDVLHCVGQLQQAVLCNQDRCAEFAHSFLQYQDLWTMDMESTLATWLAEHTTHDEGEPAVAQEVTMCCRSSLV
jgi:dynein heavy chain, axonemal